MTVIRMSACEQMASNVLLNKSYQLHHPGCCLHTFPEQEVDSEAGLYYWALSPPHLNL